MKASVPKLFFCPGSASYTPVTQGSRWRIASRQLRKPTTPSALAFFVVVRAPSGFPFSCAVQNPITPFPTPLPTRPLIPQNTAPQRLSPPSPHLPNASRSPRSKSIQGRSKRISEAGRRYSEEGPQMLEAGNASGFRLDKAIQMRKQCALPARKGKSEGKLGKAEAQMALPTGWQARYAKQNRR